MNALIGFLLTFAFLDIVYPFLGSFLETPYGDFLLPYLYLGVVDIGMQFSIVSIIMLAWFGTLPLQLNHIMFVLYFGLLMIVYRLIKFYNNCHGKAISNSKTKEDVEKIDRYYIAYLQIVFEMFIFFPILYFGLTKYGINIKESYLNLIQNHSFFHLFALFFSLDMISVFICGTIIKTYREKRKEKLYKLVEERAKENENNSSDG